MLKDILNLKDYWDNEWNILLVQYYTFLACWVNSSGIVG